MSITYLNRWPLAGDGQDIVGTDHLTAANGADFGDSGGGVIAARCRKSLSQYFWAASSAALQIPAVSSDDAANRKWWSCWVKLSSLAAGTTHMVLSKRDASKGEYALYYATSSFVGPSWRQYTPAFGGPNVTWPVAAGVGVWQWLYGEVWNNSVWPAVGIAADGGELIYEQTPGDSLSALAAGTGLFRVGGSESASQYLDGWVRDVRHGSGILSSADRASVYAEGLAALGPAALAVTASASVAEQIKIKTDMLGTGTAPVALSPAGNGGSVTIYQGVDYTASLGNPIDIPDSSPSALPAEGTAVKMQARLKNPAADVPESFTVAGVVVAPSPGTLKARFDIPRTATADLPFAACEYFLYEEVNGTDRRLDITGTLTLRRGVREEDA
jgi:hypothetical protein